MYSYWVLKIQQKQPSEWCPHSIGSYTLPFNSLPSRQPDPKKFGNAPLVGVAVYAGAANEPSIRAWTATSSFATLGLISPAYWSVPL